VRVQVLTPVGILDRDKKLGVTRDMTRHHRGRRRRPEPGRADLVQLVESPDGGWGIDGHAYTNAEIVDATRRELGAIAFRRGHGRSIGHMFDARW